jgi:hypothetical protein
VEENYTKLEDVRKRCWGGNVTNYDTKSRLQFTMFYIYISQPPFEMEVQIRPVLQPSSLFFGAMLRIRIRRIRIFLGLLDPDPLAGGTVPDPVLNPSIIKQK